jgi:microcystin-dependent protein
MPRNGSGVYSPTAGIPVVSGTTISSTVVNNVFDDLGDEITASLPVSGVAPMTGVLRVTAGTAGAPGLVPVGDTNTGIYSPGADQLGIATGGVAAVTFSATQTTSWAGKAVGKAFDVDAITAVASATTTDIGAAATSEVSITGTTTITGFGTSNAGIRRRGRFTGALILTHNGTSLILPGAVNITTAAGDAFEAVSLGSGNWAVTMYTKAAGSELPAGAVSAFAMNSAPTGWLKCNGAAVSRTTYAALFAAIGTTFGVGDGSLTFNVPDLRGEFVRAWDDGRGVDTGRVFGSAQADALQNHSHTVDSYVSGSLGTSGRPQEGTSGSTDTFQTLTSGSTGTFAAETRPRNIALLYCIKT